MDEIVLAAYDVAVGAAQWRHVAAPLAEVLDVRNLALILFDRQSGTADVLASAGARDHDRIKTYLASARKLALHATELFFPSELQHHERAGRERQPVRVARWISLSHSGADCYLAGMAIGGAGEGAWLCIGVEIVEHMNAAEVREKVEGVLPHLCRAAEIERSLRNRARRLSFGQAILDRLPFGLVQFDRDGAVVHSNAEAERISRQHSVFQIASRPARSNASSDVAALQIAIRDALASRTGAFTRWLSVKRGKGQRPYRVLVTTLSDAQGGDGHASCCALFITDPERPVMIDHHAVADAFGLTSAEAKVVARLAMGSSLSDIAGDLKVSINTVRTLLARAMGKTGTNTQVGLVCMVLTTSTLIGRFAVTLDDGVA